MSLHRVLQQVRERPIRAVELVRKRNEGTLGPKRLSELQLSRRIEPLLPMIDSGEIPIPPDMTPAVERARSRIQEKDNAS